MRKKNKKDKDTNKQQERRQQYIKLMNLPKIK